MLLLSAQNVRKSYGKVVALQDVTLELHEKEILALLGTNGSGKTTLIKILATLLTKDSGKVEIMGYDLDTHESEIRHLFGYVGQDTEHSSYARLTVKENLQFFGKLRGLKKKQIDQQIEKLSAYFDFDSNLNKLFMHLSGGQKQTVVIIRALLHNPALIYLDEPTKGLDPIIAHKIRTFLKEYTSKEGKTILLTSHILTEVDELADRVVLFHGGNNLITDTPANLKRTVGAPEFIEIQAENLPAATFDKISKLETVLLHIEKDPKWISFGISDFFNGTEAIINILRDDGVHAGFRHRVVSLEDVFVYYLGGLTEKFEV